MKTLLELTTEYRDAKAKLDAISESAKPVKAEMEKLKSDIEMSLRAMGMRSAKFDGVATLSITSKSDLAVTNQVDAMNWLKEHPEVEPDLYVGLNTTAYKTLAKEALKKTGEYLPGTDLHTTEYLTIREVKPEDK